MDKIVKLVEWIRLSVQLTQDLVLVFAGEGSYSDHVLEDALLVELKPGGDLAERKASGHDESH